MRKIAVISDTHNVLRPQVVEEIKKCDALIHAGDFTSEAILDELRRLTQVWVVRGNNDKTWAGALKDTLRFEIDGVHFFLTHDRRDIARDLNGIDVVIFGHSHKYFQDIIDGRLWLNPGGCGRPRFAQPLTMAILTIENPVAGVLPEGCGDGSACADTHPAAGADQPLMPALARLKIDKIDI